MQNVELTLPKAMKTMVYFIPEMLLVGMLMVTITSLAASRDSLKYGVTVVIWTPQSRLLRAM